MDGFQPLLVQMVEDSSVVHYLYMKQHKVREVNEAKPQDRTLFVINIPPYVHHQWFVKLFSSCGSVKETFFHKKPTAGNKEESTDLSSIRGYKVAYVVFDNPRSLNKALQLSPDKPIIMSRSDLISEKYDKSNRRYVPGIEKLKEMVETFMEDFDKKVEDEKQKAKETDGVPDEDGWITITKHSKRPMIPRNESINRKFAMKEKKRRSQKQLLNFYSFQIRESKMERLAQLRKKFQEDKDRVAVLKANRKFKPF